MTNLDALALLVSQPHFDFFGHCLAGGVDAEIELAALADHVERGTELQQDLLVAWRPLKSARTSTSPTGCWPVTGEPPSPHTGPRLADLILEEPELDERVARLSTRSAPA